MQMNFFYINLRLELIKEIILKRETECDTTETPSTG